MGLVELFIIAVGLSMDAFAVSVCKGLSVRELKPRHALTVGGGHVGRVQLHEIERFNCAQRRQFGQCAEQCGAVQSGGKTVCGLAACNRAAGSDH